MNWLTHIVEEIKWKATEIVWAIQDKIELWKANKSDEPFVGESYIEEIEVKPKKKKTKKKNVKKNKKNT